jgi:hypothetical protein
MYVSISCSDADLIPLRRRIMFCLSVLMIFSEAVAIASTDEFLRVFFCRSYLSFYKNQLQQLPPGVFSSLTSLRSLTCVVECIENVRA